MHRLQSPFALLPVLVVVIVLGGPAVEIEVVGPAAVIVIVDSAGVVLVVFVPVVFALVGAGPAVTVVFVWLVA